MPVTSNRATFVAVTTTATQARQRGAAVAKGVHPLAWEPRAVEEFVEPPV